MRRMQPVAVAVAVALALAALTGGTTSVGVPLVIMPVGLLVALWAHQSTRRGGLDFRWSARAAGTTVALDGPTMAPRDRAVAPAPSGRRQVIGALARVEGRQWLSSPWFGVGAGLTFFQTLLFGWFWATDNDGTWREWFTHTPVMAHPMVGMAVIGAHHAVTRARRDGADELFMSCPADEAIRTAAQIRAGWIPAMVVAVFVGTTSVLIAVRNLRLYGPIDGRALADVLAAVVLAVGGSALGVALARWAPWRLVPIVAVASLVPLIVGLGNLGEPHWSNARQLSTWPRYPDHALLFTDPPVWWHLVWLGALAALVGWIALAHARRNPTMIATGVTIALIAAAAAIAETRPLSAAAATRLASMVAEPAAHQTCRGDERVEVCTFEGYEDYLERVLVNVTPVAAAIPAALDSVTMRQTFDGDVALLGPEVASVLDGRQVPIDGFVPIGFLNSDEALTTARLTISLHAVGLPTRSRPGDVPVVIAGQARGVVALWLAARGLDPAEARALASHHFDPADHSDDPTPTALDLGMAWPDPCIGGSSPPVAWARQDLAAARALLDRPAAEVQQLLGDDWARLVDPATTADELLAAAGLDPVGPPDRIIAAPFDCDW